MKIFKKFTSIIVTAAVFILLFVACLYYGIRAKSFYMDTPGAAFSGSMDFSKNSVDQIVERYVNEEMDRVITIGAAGDMRFYEWQLTRAYNSETQQYDFSPSFSYISPYLESQDFTIGDIETTLAGNGQGQASGFLGYNADLYSMNFNTPEVLADNLQSAGFDMITTANEHALDSGESGLKSTIDFLSSAGLLPTGTQKNAGDQKYVIQSVKGLKVGFIAYTDVINGTLDENTATLVNYVDTSSSENVDAMCAQIRQMKNEGAEAVIVMLHFGTEMSAVPEESDRQLAHQLTAAGADVIFGSHSGVPGSIEVVNVAEDQGASRKAVVFYSMGNFLTSQQYVDGSNTHRDMGMLCEVQFTKNKENVRISQLNIIPVYSNWTSSAIAAIPIIEAYENQENFSEAFNNIYGNRIGTAYETIFPELLQSSGLNYTIEENKYKISVEN